MSLNRSIAARAALSAALVFAPARTGIATHNGGCLTPYHAYESIKRTTLRHEKLHGVLSVSESVVDEIWIGRPDRPTWTIVTRSLITGCGRVLRIGQGYYFDMGGDLEGQPL
ncbi:MAG: hypothetical protein OEQ29_08925 [Alphaproteobacteria bacterium]|nr:hypothetical protein [Alphaproteobacteria bacterium]